eukprot:scaffold153210_cov44-Prasinocladus_malaysianus.AAC.1
MACVMLPFGQVVGTCRDAKADKCCKPGEDSVGEPRDGVLLLDDDGTTQEPAGQAGGEGHVAAGAQDNMRPEAVHQPDGPQEHQRKPAKGHNTRWVWAMSGGFTCLIEYDLMNARRLGLLDAPTP